MGQTIGSSLKIVWGRPILIGTRLTVHNIVYGVYIDGLADYVKDRDIANSDAKAALEYCKDLRCNYNPTRKFCDGCILDAAAEGRKINRESLSEMILDKANIVQHLKELEISAEDEVNNECEDLSQWGWLMADILYKKYFVL